MDTRNKLIEAIMKYNKCSMQEANDRLDAELEYLRMLNHIMILSDIDIKDACYNLGISINYSEDIDNLI